LPVCFGDCFAALESGVGLTREQWCVVLMSEMESAMRKGYLARWAKRAYPESHVMDYWFSLTPENAAAWETRQAAEDDCISIYNRFGIDLEAVGGRTYKCQHFEVEERGPGEFIVCCMAPFRVVSMAEQVSGKRRFQEPE
jgi:hypothetical protein